MAEQENIREDLFTKLRNKMNYDKEKLVNQLIRHEWNLKFTKIVWELKLLVLGAILWTGAFLKKKPVIFATMILILLSKSLGKVFLSLIALTILALGVLLDMAFNVGLPRLRGFKRMWAALEGRDYSEAAKEMLDSKWARQVKTRAYTLARMMESGED